MHVHMFLTERVVSVFYERCKGYTVEYIVYVYVYVYVYARGLLIYTRNAALYGACRRKDSGATVLWGSTSVTEQ